MSARTGLTVYRQRKAAAEARPPLSSAERLRRFRVRFLHKSQLPDQVQVPQRERMVRLRGLGMTGAERAFELDRRARLVICRIRLLAPVHGYRPARVEPRSAGSSPPPSAT